MKTTTGDWTETELEKLWILPPKHSPQQWREHLRAALSAIGAVRQAPDEPSDEVISAMYKAYTEDLMVRDGLRAAYKAARLTLNAAKPDDAEYETVNVVRHGDGSISLDLGQWDMHLVRAGVARFARFPKPRVCPTCKQKVES